MKNYITLFLSLISAITFSQTSGIKIMNSTHEINAGSSQVSITLNGKSKKECL